ncbi:DNA-3-methyladenine glycosylase 2 family protein [Staphylococcus saprophyticus]|uniref:DNA-3-methyladenine glycosylase family protein n=1 Tax=Staphylococcus saprophyticus TaxID=29385 RepID=UPI00297A1970|nr:DNA-3-methyladenine glycosylase 2 family protein [Staphylococcus saprophyticus]MDW4404697.1 DNA-3-methyladenine glycosylase 2 family protein [Staphylococcus saprophyticus]MDW4439649.1 DNA-3-methyladenine glycosylase 2 family protein [Staphylococcus saprophyticus]MDW4472532.1 DNA-3-methyladenine glycosylase 2 family protein [Staphylococcus saprophyticus]
MNTWQISVQDACVQTLIKQDATLAHLINQIGDLQIQTRPDPLKSLIRSIIGQQITVAVAQSIFQKLSIAIDDHWTVNQLSQLRESEMKALGLSQSKINYIQNVLFAVRNGQLNFEQLYKMDDNSVINALTQIKGIGRWTAEVFLLFTLQRKNILPIYDVGLQRAAQWLYQTTKAERKKQLTICKEQWQGCASIGAFYLWEAIHQDSLQYDSIYDIPKDHKN